MREIVLAKKEDAEQILALYHSNLFGPADWDEHYPNKDTIEFDLKRDALFVMKDEKGEVLATISIDDDDAVTFLDVWDENLAPGGELARLCVREDVRNQGIAKEMMLHCFDELKRKGFKSVHILVRPEHIVALKSYSKLGFETVGKTYLFEKDFVCMEMPF